jgi:hypothetical protein
MAPKKQKKYGRVKFHQTARGYSKNCQEKAENA